LLEILNKKASLSYQQKNYHEFNKVVPIHLVKIAD